MNEADSPGATPRDSLVARLVKAAQAGFGRLRDWPAAPRTGGWGFAGLIAFLLALGPILTILGGGILARRESVQAARMAGEAAPRVSAQQASQRDRDQLAKLLQQATVGATVEALARALPPEAALLRAERGEDGALEIEVRTPDPDKLRAALRREPRLASMRDSGQRQSDAAMIVVFRGAGE